MRLGKIDPPERVYFYKRRDGSVFSCKGAEAWAIHTKYEYIGTSSGSIFYSMLVEEQARQDALLGKATTDAKRKKLEEQFVKDTSVALKKAFDAELEEARKDRTPPMDTSYIIEGQRMPGIESRIANMF